MTGEAFLGLLSLRTLFGRPDARRLFFEHAVFDFASSLGLSGASFSPLCISRHTKIDDEQKSNELMHFDIGLLLFLAFFFLMKMNLKEFTWCPK